MNLYEVMRTTFSARAFTDEPVPDTLLYRLVENARFAPSGGNRQGWHVIIVRGAETKAAIAACAEPAGRRYAAQSAAGEAPWNTVIPTKLDAATIAATRVPSVLTRPIADAPVVLVVCADLRRIASLDSELDRVGIVSGASVYPFVWNMLLAARNEGLGGTITTVAIAEEPRLKALLGIPGPYAVCAVVPLGYPATSLTRLKRRPVAEIATLERFDGAPLAE